MIRLSAFVVASFLLLIGGCSKSLTVESNKTGENEPTVAKQVAAVPLLNTDETKADVPSANPVMSNDETKKTEKPTSQPPDEKKGLERLIASAEPGIVRIDVTTKEGGSIGSGFIIDDSGIVVTNQHVINGANSAKVTFADKSSAPVVGVLGSDVKRDIAILKIEASDKKLTSLKLRKEKPQKGQAVVAFGAPQGLSFSVSEGIISGLRSAAELGDLASPLDGEWIQTTTPISPGNSGGPLVDLSGQVVGINTFNFVKGQNLNFAASATDIDRVFEQSKKSEALPLAMTAQTENLGLVNEPRSLKIPPRFNYDHAIKIQTEKRPLDAFRTIAFGPVSFDDMREDEDSVTLLGVMLVVGDDDRVADNALLAIRSLSLDWRFRNDRTLRLTIDDEVNNLGAMAREYSLPEPGKRLRSERLSIPVSLPLLLKIGRSQSAKISVGGLGGYEQEFGNSHRNCILDLLSRLPATKTTAGFVLEIDEDLKAAQTKAEADKKAAIAATAAKIADEQKALEEKKANASLTLAKKYAADGKARLAKTTIEGIIKRYPQTDARREADELLKSLTD